MGTIACLLMNAKAKICEFAIMPVMHTVSQRSLLPLAKNVLPDAALLLFSPHQTPKENAFAPTNTNGYMRTSLRTSTFFGLAFLILNLFFAGGAFGQANGDYRSAASGAWSTAANWQKYNGTTWMAASTAPTSSDGVVNIIAGHTITLSAIQSCSSLIVGDGTNNSTTTLDITGFTLTVTGNTSVVSASGGRAGTVTIGSGTLTVGGNLTSTLTAGFEANNQLNFTGAGTLNIAGNWSYGGTFTPGTSTINFTKATGTQTVSNNLTFYNLNLPNNSTVVDFVTNTVTITNGLNVAASTSTVGTTSSSCIMSGSSTTITGAGTKKFKNITISAGTTCSVSGGVVNISGSFTNNGTYTQTSGSINPHLNLPVNFTAGANASTTFFDFKVEGASTVVNAGNLNFTVNGQFSIGSATFNGQSNTVSFGSNSSFIAGTGTINFNNVIVNSSLSNAASQSFNVGGNWTNNGTYTAGTETITFNRTDADQTIGGASTTTFNKIQVSKGNANRVLEATSVIGMAPGGLTLTSGTFKISSASSVIASTNTNFTIGSTSGIHLNNAAASFNIGGNGGSATVDGAMILSNGTINIGSGNNSLVIGATGTYNQTSGTVNIKGRLQVTNAGSSFTLSNGNFNILSGGTVSTGSNSIFYVANASLSITGGTVSIASPNQNLALADITIDKTGIPIIGGKFLITTGNTGSVKTITVNSNVPFYNFEVQQGTDVLTAKLISNNLQVSNDLTITSGTLDANGKDVLVKGNWTNNGGTFTPGTGTVSFTNTIADQTIGGTATAQTFNNISVAKGANKLIIGGSTTTATVGGTLTMTSGNIDCGTATLELGTSAASVGTLTYTAGNIIGNFKRWINAASPTQWLFPVGTATANRKALVTFTNLINGSLTAKFNASDPGSTGLPLSENSLLVSNQFTEGYWSLIAANSLASTNYALELNGTGFSSYGIDGNTRIIKRPTGGGSWVLDGSHVTAVSPTAKRSGLSGFSEFALATTTTAASQCPSATAVTSAADQTLCQGATANQLTAIVTTSGSSGTPTLQYQWYYNTANGTSGATKIVNATSATYTPLTTAAETGTRYYFAVGYAADNGCGQTDATFSLASNLVKITVAPTSVGGAASSNQTICTGSTPADLTLSGQTGSVIKWQQSTTSNFSAGVTDIANTTTTLTGASIGSLTATTYFRAVVQSGSCAVAYSAAAAIAVKPLPSATIGSDVTVCQNASQPNITFTGANGTAPYTFTYKLNNGSPQPIQTTSGNSVTLAVPTTAGGTFAYELVSVQDATPNACGNTASGTATVTVQAITATPVVASPVVAGATSVSGTSNEGPGTSVQLFVNGLPVGSPALTVPPNWTVSGIPSLSSGDVVTAKATAGGKCTSAASAPVIVSAITSTPTVSSPLCEGTTSISGTSSEATGTVITVFVNNVSAGTTTVNGGMWTKTVTALVAGTGVTATATASGANESSPSAVVVVQTNGTLTLTSGTGTNTQTVCVNSPIAKIFYSLGGSATGYSIMGLPTGVTHSFNGGTIAIQGMPTVAGAFNYTVTATGSACSNPTANGSITVNPTPTLTGASQAAAVCQGSSASINLTGLLPNSTSTIAYSINTTAQMPVTSVVADGSGMASFATSALTLANNGQTLTVTGVTVTSATPNCSASFTKDVTLAVNNCSPITQFYVNDNSQSGDSYTGNVGNDANPGTQISPFATINHAISVAPAGSTIYVDAGTYAENVNVSKSLTILGSNASINPNTGTRIDEAIVVPATNNVSAGRIFDVNANNVSIKGFTIDGDNTAISGGYAANGTDNNAAIGIACGDDPSPDGFNNLLVENNIIKNLGNATNFNAAFYGSGSQSGARTGSNFQNNKVDNAVLWGIVTENNFYTNVQNNVITRTGRGIQFDNTWIGGVPVTIANNNVKYYRRGVLVNLRYGTATPVTVSGNTIQPETSGIQEDGTSGPAAVNRGLMVWSIDAGAGNITLTDNNISNAWYGEELWNNALGKVSQSGGLLNNNQYGIYLPTNQDAYGNAAYGSNASVTRVTISNSVADGVWLNDNNASANTINLLLTNAFISSGVNSIRVSGNDVVATINNNSLTGSSAKAIDASAFTNATPINAMCNWYGDAGYSVVSSKVSGNVSFMPYLTSGADSDPATSGFQPMANACNSGIQFYVNDASTANGMYTTAAGNDGNPGTPSQPFASISHAVSVAPAEATIYVDAGTYQEQVIVNKSLNIVGAGRSGGSVTKILAPATVPSQPTANGTTRAIVLATGVSNIINISKVFIDGNGVGGAGFTGVHYDEASGTFENSRITGIRDATFSGVQSGDAFVANHKYDVVKSQTVTVNNNIIDDYQKSGVVINELNTHGIVTNNTITGQNTKGVNGQNGIQFAFGSYGTITGNTVSNNLYNDPTNTYVASGILIAGAGIDFNNAPTGGVTTISNNTLVNNDAGLYTDEGGYGYDSNAGLTEGPNTYTGNYTHVSVNAPATVPNGSNVYDKRVDNTAQTNVVYGQIQRAIDYAAATNTLNASGHTFTEQVEINKDLTLNGVAGSTKILSPAVLPLSFATNDANKAIVYVHDAANVTVQNLTVDGAGKGNANYRFEGIAYFNAGGAVLNTSITGIRNTPLDGMQGGVGLYAWADAGTARALIVNNNTVTDYQKNAMTFRGSKLTATITANTVTGSGPLDFIAQNGIQLSYGAKGSLTGNTVSNIGYITNTDTWSAGILLYQAADSTVVKNNTVTNVQAGIYSIGNKAGIVENNISNTVAGMGGIGSWYGVVVEDGNVAVKQNTINNGGKGNGVRAEYYTGETTTVTAVNNFISNAGAGAVIYTDGSGGIAAVNINENSITSVDTAIYNAGAIQQYATCNWYGTTDNSLIAPKIKGLVTYQPYLTNGTDADPAAGFQPMPGSCNGPALNVSVASQTNVLCFGNTGLVTVSVTGGNPGYQYSIDGTNFQSSSTFNGLTAGSYTVTVKDNAAATATVNVIITGPTAPVTFSSVTQVNNACNGGSDGSITATATGGTPGSGYQYSLSGTTAVAFSSNNVFSHLAAGTYTVTVKDANGCTTSVSKTITAPTATTPDGTLTVPVLPDNFLSAPGANITFVFEVREQNGNAITNALLRITNQSGYTFSLPNVTTVTTQEGDTYPIDNSHWTATNAGPFYNVSLNSGQQIGCGQAKYVAVTITRTTLSRSVFTLTSTLRDVNSELNSQKANNSATLLFVAQ